MTIIVIKCRAHGWKQAICRGTPPNTVYHRQSNTLIVNDALPWQPPTHTYQSRTTTVFFDKSMSKQAVFTQTTESKDRMLIRMRIHDSYLGWRKCPSLNSRRGFYLLVWSADDWYLAIDLLWFIFSFPWNQFKIERLKNYSLIQFNPGNCLPPLTTLMHTFICNISLAIGLIGSRQAVHFTT